MLQQKLEELKSENVETRRQAAENLGTIGGTEAVDSLADALRDQNCSVREAAAGSLNALGWEPEDDQRKALYAVALEDWDGAADLGEAAVEPLMTVLRDRNELLMQEKAAEALIEIGEAAVHPLIETLKDENEEVREVASAVLVDIGKPAVKSLIEALKDKKVLKEVAEILIEIGTGTIKPLIDALANMGI